MKILTFCLLIISAALFISAGVGSFYPRYHLVTRSASFHKDKDSVWQLLMDPSLYPTWRPGVTQIEKLPSKEDHPAWREEGRFGKMSFQIVDQEVNRSFILHLSETAYPISAVWFFELDEPAPGETRLKITEKGEVRNPLLRLYTRTADLHRKILDDLLESIGHKLGQPTTAVN